MFFVNNFCLQRQKEKGGKRGKRREKEKKKRKRKDGREKMFQVGSPELGGRVAADVARKKNSSWVQNPIDDPAQ